MRNPESEAAFRLVLEQPELDDRQKCIARYHLAQSVFKQRQRPRAAPFDDAVAAWCTGWGENDDLHMKSLYQGARCRLGGTVAKGRICSQRPRRRIRGTATPTIRDCDRPRCTWTWPKSWVEMARKDLRRRAVSRL